ncbi:hypothetical protein AC062_1704 [Pasteurellaceae bacterium NI1060]|nr:hypothetical protein AC062_1704 [Pasteurellaceae bacterium NI1060]
MALGVIFQHRPSVFDNIIFPRLFGLDAPSAMELCSVKEK